MPCHQGKPVWTNGPENLSTRLLALVDLVHGFEWSRKGVLREAVFVSKFREVFFGGANTRGQLTAILTFGHEMAGTKATLLL